MKYLVKVFVAVLILSSCSDFDEEKQSEVSINIESSNNDTVIVQQVNETSIQPKTQEEIIEDAVIKTIALSIDYFKNMKVNDSIKMASREKMFAYQIGFAINDKDELFEQFKKLDDKENIYVLKQSRNDYFLIKYSGKGEKELLDSLQLFENSINQDVKVINMMELCSKNKKLVRGEKLTKRKEVSEIPCLVCDK